VEIEKEGMRLSFEYKILPSHLLIKNTVKLHELYENDQKIIKATGFEPERFKELKSFSLKNKSSKADVFEILPEKYQIYFCPDEKNDRVESSVFVEQKLVLITGDLSKPLTILSLFHEIGHLVDDKIMGDKDKEERHKESRIRYNKAGQPIKSPDDTGVYKPTENDLVTILNSERNAWAFAIKKLKPFLKNLNIDNQDLRVYIHDYALKSYSKK